MINPKELRDNNVTDPKKWAYAIKQMHPAVISERDLEEWFKDCIEACGTAVVDDDKFDDEVVSVKGLSDDDKSLVCDFIATVRIDAAKMDADDIDDIDASDDGCFFSKELLKDEIGKAMESDFESGRGMSFEPSEILDEVSGDLNDEEKEKLSNEIKEGVNPLLKK